MTKVILVLGLVQSLDCELWADLAHVFLDAVLDGLSVLIERILVQEAAQHSTLQLLLETDS